jgi:cell division initiation protein
MKGLTPLEIQRAAFPRRLQGFDTDAVRDFLGQIAEHVEEDARNRGELRAQIARLGREVEEYRERADALNQALLAAERTAEATVARAEAEGQRIVSEAQALADKILEEATRRAENIELVIGQLRGRRRGARADLKRLAELLGGVAADDETAEERDNETPSVALLRPRLREGKSER